MNWIDTWPKRISALVMAAGAVGALISQGYGHFAKTYEVVEIRIELSESALLKIQESIFELENARAKRPLTEIEEKRLRQLKEQEQDIINKLKEQRQRL